MNRQQGKSQFIAGLCLAGLFLAIPLPVQAEGPDIRELLTARSANSSRIELYEFYAARGFKAAWNGENRKVALDVLASAAREGLMPENYYLPGKADIAASDIDLTRSVLRYAKDVRIGRLPPAFVYGDVDFGSQPFDAGTALRAALDNGELPKLFSDLPPEQSEYAFLRTALAQYRRIAAEGGWRPFPPLKGAVADLPPGEQEALLNRLSAEDPTIDRSTSDEATLNAALLRFQSRHGLEADGKIGPHTLKALNITASARVLQIEANMERWRWLPHRLEDRYIMVNTADASLQAVDNGKVVLTSRVVVGKPRSPTPMFAATIVAVTVNPPWNVPASIARKELLPKLKRNRAYLAGQQMVLSKAPPGDPHGLTVNWAAISRSHFPYQIQQLPGRTNALGQLKLEMPNRFDVYLHDTPAKGLFARNDRFFSHGCMRVQQVGALAKYALTGNPEADVARLIAKDDTTDRLPLDKPLKAYVVYWTVFRDADGNIAFRDDIYGRDERLISALFTKRIAQRSVPQIECSA